jgi:hypothetical protein
MGTRRWKKDCLESAVVSLISVTVTVSRITAT